MRKGSVVSAGLACLVVLAAGADALAKPRHRHDYAVSQNHGPAARGPINVERRSFLDPGPVVPVGSTNRYMVEQTYYRQDTLQANQRSLYGGELLPRRGEQPWDPGVPVDWME